MAQFEDRPTEHPLKVEWVPPNALKPNPKNARRHTDKQIAKLASAIREFGFANPIIINRSGRILAGLARWKAALRLALEHVPCLRLDHLSDAQEIAYAIADNKLGDLSSFDPDALRTELQALVELDFNVELTGFDTAEVDLIFDGATATASADPADNFEEPDPNAKAVNRLGDLWNLDGHRLLCGDALSEASYKRLLGDRRAQLVFSDPPYNVAIQGHVSGMGRVKHREFAQASGEMTVPEFRDFLKTSMTHFVAFSENGSIHYICMDWRHIQTLLEAGGSVYSELKNLCVWSKTNAGMGSLYRSQHELVAVFKNGTARHQNNVELGKHGRYRTNVWTYPGATAFSATRDEDLAAHPTVKPVALVADAIRDCSRRGATVLDGFGGSGTTILAAERTGRKAAVIELDPLYVDTAIARWEHLTGKPAILEKDGRTFHEVQLARDVAFEDAQPLDGECDHD